MSEKTENKQTLAEEINILLEGAEVSDEFKDKFATILEATISTKVAEREQQLKEDYEQKLEESKAQVADEMEETISRYLDYVVEQWMKENELAVETGIKNELTESFILGMKKLFEAHYVEVPEGKEDILAAAEEKVDTLEKALSEQLAKVADLREKVEEFERNAIIEEVSEGLVETQKEKLASLVEGIEFVDRETYAEKVKTIKESFFKKEDVTSNKQTKTDTSSNVNDDIDERMKQYLSIF